jgi:hypothetical protein
MRRIAVLLLVPLFAAAAEAPPETTRVTSAIVFKNGLAFIAREGTVSFAGGKGTISPIPDAFLGTLWIGATGRTIDELHAASGTYDMTRAVTTIPDLIEANPGKAVVLRIGDRDYNGTLVPPPAAEEAETERTVAAAGLVLINVDGRVHAFPRSAVQSIAFAQPPATSLRVPATRSVLELRSRGADAAVPVTISYLRGGVSWMPEYSVVLVDGEHAKLTMQATLIDDTEDLRDTDVRFAVGYPNFEFANVGSPLAPKQSLDAFLGSLSGGRTYSNSNSNITSNVMTNMTTQNVVFSNETAGRPSFVGGAPETGEGSEDLFFYERAGVTLAGGERASYPILSASVPYRHVYQWDVVAETESTRSDAAGGLAGQVWHSVALTNSGTTPWTTGPALVTANGKPLAQDKLSYTSAGATGLVKLTIATDVAVWREEVEVARTERARRFRGSDYDELTIEGTLKMHNYKREAITLGIDKMLDGQTVSSTPEAKVTKRAAGARAVNPTERLRWELPLAAGEAKTLRYTYKVYVP